MNSIEQIAEKFKSKKIGLFFEEELSARSSFKIGGKAALLAEPSDEESLAFALTEIRNAKIPYFVLGGGTNVLFDDSGFDGIVVSTKKLAGIDVTKDCPIKSGNDTVSQAQEAAPVIVGRNSVIVGRDPTILKPTVIVRAGAGASMAALVSFAQENALTGLEEFAGLPGTVGGAVYMNARCFEKEISQVVGKIRWLEPPVIVGRDPTILSPKEAVFAPSDWDYKKSPFTGTGRVVLSVEFIVQKGDKASIAQKAAAFIQERKNKGHYKAPCAGSVFKNNRAFGRPTGKIIDELGLKGERRGGAQIAPFHGNIIINAGGASSADVRALVDLCKARAKEKFGIELEEEIVLVD